MGKEILQKYTIFEVKRQLAEMEKQYGKEQVKELLGEDRAAEIDRAFKKTIAKRLEPYWNDIQSYKFSAGVIRRQKNVRLPLTKWYQPILFR